MLGTGASSSLCNSICFLTQNTASQRNPGCFLQYTNKAHLPFASHLDSIGSRFTFCFKTGVFLSSLHKFQQTHLNLSVYGNGLCTLAVKNREKGGLGMVEVNSTSDESDCDNVEGNDDDDDDDDGDEEIYLPPEQMNDWVKQKPRGFGEGKVYDTSIEDKLFEELKHIRQAQAANLNKLKNNPIEPSSKKVPEAAPSGVRVRLVNLPKKKNIQRDLKSAFQGIPGIIDIIPAVSGNKKTKDPICRGFAFVDFRSEEAAARFVQLYSTQNIAFGKVQKLIKCEILNSKSSSSDCLQASDNHNAAEQLTIPASEANINGTSIVNDPTLDSLEEITYDDSDDPVEELFREESPKVAENLQSDNASKVDVDDGVEPRENSEADSLSSMQLEINSTTESKISAKRKVKNAPQKKLLGKGKVKVPKLGIPGSAKRLKIKEKAVLTDVFSKYGRKAELAAKTD